MSDFKDTPIEEDDGIDDIQMQEKYNKALVKFCHVKDYVIIDQSKPPREFGVYTEYRRLYRRITNFSFSTWDDIPWEEQDVWKESEVCNLDGSPIFGGYFFTNFEEFCKNSEANFARLRMEKARNQMTSKL